MLCLVLGIHLYLLCMQPLSLAPLSVLLAAQQSTQPAVPDLRRPPRPARRPNFSVPFFSRQDPYAPPPPTVPTSPRIASAGSPRIPSTTPQPDTSTRRWNPFTHTLNYNPAPAPTSEGTELRDHTSKKEVEDMQLALLVAMPVEPGKGRGAGEVPVLEIGVRVVGARVPSGSETVAAVGKQTV